MICGKKVERIRSLLLQNYDLCYRYAFRASQDRNGALPNYLRKVSLPNLRRRVILFRESLCKESASRKVLGINLT